MWPRKPLRPETRLTRNVRDHSAQAVIAEPCLVLFSALSPDRIRMMLGLSVVVAGMVVLALHGSAFV